MRRKGEQPVAKRLVQITPTSAVVMSITEGDHRFDAWVAEASTPWSKLARLTGIPGTRFSAIRSGDKISRAEIDALAQAWSVSSENLINTIPDHDLVVA